MWPFRKKRDWRSSPVHWKLLATYMRPNAPQAYPPASKRGWKVALGESIERATKRFLKEGLIAIVEDPASLLEYKYTAKELRQMARKLGVATSGTKATLAKRITEADPKFARKKAKVRHPVYQCTEQGRELVQRWQQQEKERREAVESKLLLLLTQKKIDQAIHLFRQYNATLPFPYQPPMGWEAASQEVRALWRGWPTILRPIPRKYRGVLRAAAALALMSGGEIKESWLPEEQLHPTMANTAAARMLLFAQSAKRTLRELRRAGFKRVQILASGQHTCQACLSLQGVYPIDRVPELPNPQCVNPLGCRCTYVAGV